MGVVRSHEVPETLRGAHPMHNGKLCTVFSASNYCGNSGNFGGVLICPGTAPLHPYVSEHWAPSWSVLAYFYSKMDGISEEERKGVVERHETPHGIGKFEQIKIKKFQKVVQPQWGPNN